MARPLPSPQLDDAPLASGLYVVATPIGNLRDITLRALDVLAQADLVLAEDTRVSGKLLQAFGLAAKLERYDEHGAERTRPRALAALGDDPRPRVAWIETLSELLAALHHLADFEVGPNAFAECLRQAEFNYTYEAADDDEGELR